MNTRRLVAALAVRNAGSRLYGKPLQRLDIASGVTILDQVLDALASVPEIDEVVLGVSEGSENAIFTEIANQKGLRSISGDQTDVLGRLIACGQAAGATDIFRMTSESPFPHLDAVAEAWQTYLAEDLDGFFYDDIIDGCGFEILSLAALERSHRDGEERHRSELCTLYMRENPAAFRLKKVSGPEALRRKDLRLTVDYPEDLVICRAIYQTFKAQAPRIGVGDIVAFLDANPELIRLTAPFAEEGYSTMYVWNESKPNE